jgi:hypothetical protein
MRRNDPAKTPLAAQLLDQVYDAMLRSDYGALPALGARLEAVLQGPPLSEADLQLIRHKADRNGAVLLAAQRGIKAARRRLADVRAATGSLVTYDRSGRRAEHSDSRNLAQRL